MSTGTPHNEKELLLQVTQGSETAFHILYNRWRDRIFSISYRLTKSEPAAEDVVQEIFIKLWVNKEKLNEINNFGAYINILTRNHIFGQMRKLAIEESYLRDLIASENLQNRKNTSDIIVYNELKKLFNEAIAQLPPQQKKVYQLGKLEGKKYGEIASILHISRETVKNHMIHAMRSIKAFLSKHEGLLGLLLFSIANHLLNCQ